MQNFLWDGMCRCGSLSIGIPYMEFQMHCRSGDECFRPNPIAGDRSSVREKPGNEGASCSWLHEGSSDNLSALREQRAGEYPDRVHSSPRNV